MANIFKIQNNSFADKRRVKLHFCFLNYFLASLSSMVSWPWFPFHCLFSSSHFSLSTISISSLQFLLSVAVFLNSSLSRSLWSNPHRNFSPLSRLSPSTFWAYALIASFSSPILSAWQAHVNLLLANFYLKTSYAGIIHELSTFPLRLRDLRLFPITSSTFFQTIYPLL